MKKIFTLASVVAMMFAGAQAAMAQETLVVDGSASYTWYLQQGTDYILPGTDGSWYCQPGFFTHKEGDKWTFRGEGWAMYAYAIVLDADKKYIDVQLLNATGGEGVEGTPTATYDVNQAIWVNGNENIGFPSYQNNAINWGGGKDVPVPQIADGLYQLVMVGGQQINASSINFKFFKGKNWGGDMDENMLYMVENDYMRLNGQDEAVSGDHGNIFGKDGNVGDLDTLVVTIDFNNTTNGKGTVTVEKRAYTPAAYPQLNGTDLTKFGNSYYANVALKPGDELNFAHLDAVELKWEDIYVNEYFAKKGDNKLVWSAVEGNYCVEVVPSLNYIRLYPGAYGEPASYQNGKALWIVGNGQIGLPSYAAMPSGWGESNGWNPDLRHSLPVAQVEPNIYKIAFTVGQELGSDVNFKFYSQGIGWGTEFRGEDLYMVENDYLMLKQPEATVGYDENGNEVLQYGDEDGNIRNGVAPLGKGDKLVVTVDLNGFEFHLFDPIAYEVVKHPGKVSVEYTGSEAPKPTFAGATMQSSGDWYYADVELEQGKQYSVKNLTEVSCDELYTDECFAAYKGNDTFGFNAVSGRYCVMINTVSKYLKIFPGTHAAPAGIEDGGLWIIGEGFGRPSVNGYAAGWNTGIEKDFAVAQVQPNVYAMNLMCDTEMWDNWCNWKFFGQPDWGIEFKPGTDFSITSDNQWLNVGESDGNIGFKEGAAFVKGEPIYIVVDFSAGLNAGVMTVDTKPILEGIQSITLGTADSAIYNLAGQRINNAAQHGVYIINGKKVVR